MTNLASELRTYCRDEHGKIIKEYDHLMDAMRYLILSGVDIMKTDPKTRLSAKNPVSAGNLTWMSR
jgi:hypothetical protein